MSCRPIPVRAAIVACGLAASLGCAGGLGSRLPAPRAPRDRAAEARRPRHRRYREPRQRRQHRRNRGNGGLGRGGHVGPRDGG